MGIFLDVAYRICKLESDGIRVHNEQVVRGVNRHAAMQETSAPTTPTTSGASVHRRAAIHSRRVRIVEHEKSRGGERGGRRWRKGGGCRRSGRGGG